MNNEREKHFLERRKKKITLNKIANAIGCSISLLSKYENNHCDMASSKIERYKTFIEQYQK
ncbi:transcriptional regulator [Alkalihalophilus pseudofirmus]|uniref:helix-turn-helix domain-containing protein n=1 Tax=Alkalihalophilus pseudofirmus TaxID=79885 RepID=UPI000952754C|nr:transcriptional regulator [Alkalihalophilus pseudofirmus]